MSPPSAPCGPVERGFVVVSINAVETHVPRAGGVGLRQSHLPRLDGFSNSKLAASGHALT